ncbi:MAG: SUMF1/EgtB/PvdO family nonheme iron enzyme [Polyangiaceae bacterium]
MKPPTPPEPRTPTGAPGLAAGGVTEQVGEASAATQDAHIGLRIGQYRLTRQLGRGGMGSVFMAIHQSIGQVAAVKVMSSWRSGDTTFLRRFENEARAASRVDHPGLVKIFDFGHTESGEPYLLMEYVAGELLRHRIQRLRRDRTSLAPSAVAQLARQAASALASLHEAGIVHRDLKPENMMIVPDDEAALGERVKILDFGIARIAESTHETGPGHVLGTGAYMSPEQCAGDAGIDGRSDVYSLGVVLYELLAGHPPFQGNFGTLLHCHLHEPPRSLAVAAPDAPRPLVDLVHRMLAKPPTARPDMAELVPLLRALEAPLSADLPLAAPHDTRETASPRAPRPEEAAATTIEKNASRPTGPAANPAVTEPAVMGPIEERASPADIPRPAGPRRKPVWVAVAVALAGGLSVVLGPLLSRPARPEVVLANMVYLPGGTFRMGSTPAEIDAECARLGAGCRRDLIEREQPPREVTLSPFYLDVNEVTNADLAAWLENAAHLLIVEPDPDQDGMLRYVKTREGGLLAVDLYPGQTGIQVREGKFEVRPGFERKPAIQVTWDGARLYCSARGKRLPTEAEWEFAARGSVPRRFPWGDDPPRCDGTVFGRAPDGACPDKPAGPQDVGTSPQDRTPEGVLDLGGNVGEWVADQFVLSHYPPCGDCADPKVEEPAPLTDDLRIFRGGSWSAAEQSSRTTTRSRWKRTDLTTGLGFRCATR